jgi:DNA-binding transcriptional LysR family regulator
MSGPESRASSTFAHSSRISAHDATRGYDRVLSVCAAAGFAPTIVQEADELFTVLSLVRAGLGISLVPRSAALMRLPGVRFRELTLPRPPGTSRSPGTAIPIVFPSSGGSSRWSRVSAARAAVRSAAMDDRRLSRNAAELDLLAHVPADRRISASQAAHPPLIRFRFRRPGPDRILGA